ncbi:hypothetical protein QOT17_017588 [Balamuthia mandrillaris]
MNFHLGGWDQLCSCREEESSPPVEESPFQMADEALLFSNVNDDPETSYHHRSINLVQPSPKPPKPMTRSQSARTLSNRRSSSLAIEELEELLFQTCMEPELAAVDDRQLVEAAVQQWGPSLQQPIQPSRSSAPSSCSQHPLQIGTVQQGFNQPFLRKHNNSEYWEMITNTPEYTRCFQ